MKNLPLKIMAGAAVTLSSIGAFTPLASAAQSAAPARTAATSNTAPVLAAIKAKAASAISLRDRALEAAVGAVQNNHYLTTSDQSTVLTTLNHDLSGLNALGPVIQADTTVAKARSDYITIFSDYRVFALALPQARLAASADDLTGTVLPRLTDAQTKLAALLSGPDQAKNSSSVQTAMSDLASQITTITNDTKGVSAQVLAYTPSAWDTNPTILAQPRADLVTARGDAHEAHSDIATVVEALK